MSIQATGQMERRMAKERTFSRRQARNTSVTSKTDNSSVASGSTLTEAISRETSDSTSRRALAAGTSQTRTASRVSTRRLNAQMLKETRLSSPGRPQVTFQTDCCI